MIFKPNKLLLILGFISLNLTFWCAAESKNIEIECREDVISDLAVPDLVLIRTDVVDIKRFKKTQEQFGKNYSTEIGGSTLALSLDLTSDYLTIVRTFKEPGQSVHAKTYNICILEENLSSDQLRIRVVNNGVLILETEPGVEGIPNDLWILYDKIR